MGQIGGVGEPTTGGASGLASAGVASPFPWNPAAGKRVAEG